MHNDIKHILFTEEQLKEKVAELGAQISADYQGKNLVVICILRGSFIFTADQVRCINVPCTVDFMSVSSYGSGSVSTGRIRIIKDLSDSIEGKDVLVGEDILDSGNTLSHLIDVLKLRGPASIQLCTLLNKPSRRVRDVYTKYCGFDIEDHFVVGYGLDYAERYRTLPYIGILKPEVYEVHES